VNICGLDVSVLGEGQVVDYCEHCSETWVP